MRRSIFAGTAALLIVLGLCAPPAAADSLFSDDFESGFGKWTGKPGSWAAIVVDPLDSTNHALSFRNRNTAGDVFSVAIPVSQNQTVTLSFDYLGLTNPIGGGLVGINDGTMKGTTPPTTWVAAFTGNGSYPEVMVDDGSWHSYSVEFDTGSFTKIGLVIEDWQGAPGYNAYFDNIEVTNVPEPASAWLVLGLLSIAGLACRRRTR